MAESRSVENYKYASRVLDFKCVVDDAGIPIFAPSMYLFHLAKTGQAKTSIRAYSFDLTKFFTVLEHTENVQGIYGIDYREMTDEQMSRYLHGYLKVQLQLKDSTVERHIASLTGFYQFAYSHGLMDTFPHFTYSYGDEETKTSIMQGLTTKLHETFMDEETFKEVVLANFTTKDPFLRERDELALLLGYHAGFRTEELVIEGNLCVKKLKKLLPKEKEKRVPRAIKLDVLGKGDKTRSVQLTVKGTTAIYDFLWGRAKHIKTTLMCNKKGKPLSYESYGTELFRGCINTYLAKTTLNEDEVKTWQERRYHTLRKCYATNMVMFCQETGQDPRVFVTQWMGHEDPETTEIYIFYDAVLNKRLKVMNDLNLQKAVFGQLYHKKYKKGDK